MYFVLGSVIVVTEHMQKKPFYTAEISVFQGTIYQETDNSIASSEKAKKGRGGDQAEEHSGTIIVLLIL